MFSSVHRLQELLRNGRYGIGRTYNFLVGSTERRTFDDLHLRMITTSTGFYVAMEVKPITADGGQVRFRPAITPSGDTVLTFGIAVSIRPSALFPI